MIGDCAKLKSSPLEGCLTGGDFFCGTDFGVGSKKLPPLNGAEETFGTDGAAVEIGPEPKPPIPENAELLDCNGGAAAVAVLELGKLRPLKASVRPPKASFCCAGGDAIPPKRSCLACCGSGAGAGLGADEYSDKMDCFKSGREGPFIARGFAAELAGRALAGWELPKKSKPSNESPGFVCFVAVGAARGCGRTLSVVLGLAGGEGASSPNRSMFGAGFLAAGGGG